MAPIAWIAWESTRHLPPARGERGARAPAQLYREHYREWRIRQKFAGKFALEFQNGVFYVADPSVRSLSPYMQIPINITKQKPPGQRDMPLMDPVGNNIVLFHPHIPKAAADRVSKTLATSWIGQGPQVEAFEERFSERFAKGRPSIAVGSGTDALHVAYILAGLKRGDEVVSPVFTCTATNIPLLYEGVTIRFADVQRGTLNIDPQHVRTLVNDRTKAIICVHYGGLPCDMDELHAVAAER